MSHGVFELANLCKTCQNSLTIVTKVQTIDIKCYLISSKFRTCVNVWRIRYESNSSRTLHFMWMLLRNDGTKNTFGTIDYHALWLINNFWVTAFLLIWYAAIIISLLVSSSLSAEIGFFVWLKTDSLFVFVLNFFGNQSGLLLIIIINCWTWRNNYEPCKTHKHK